MTGAPRKSPQPWLKPGVFVGALVPAADLALGGLRHTLGADAISLVLNRFGLLTLIFLVASLACTPVRNLTGWTWVIRIRRMLGLFAFAYATAHVTTYVVFDQGFDWPVIFADITQRKFILVGFLAWVLLIPLAATSTDWSVRKLKFKRWKQLHRLAYVATVLGVIHFILRVKRDETVPLTYAAIVLALFALRGWERVQKGRAQRARA